MTLPFSLDENYRGNWTRVSRRRPCPICERADWCLYAGPFDAPTAAICARVESARRCGEAGWLHRLRDDDWRWPAVRTRRVLPGAGTPRLDNSLTRDWRRFVGDCEEALGDGRLHALTGELGVSAESLARLRVGWSREHAAFTFPMFDAAGQVLGVRLRGSDGRKWAVRGGHEGLFIARFDDRSAGGGDAPAHAVGEEDSPALIVCEGPTDCAALVDLGFRVVGRPSCTGGVRLIVELVERLRPGEVAILADGDPPGLRGAYNLASVLAVYSPCVRVATPPDGVKDARAWKRAGATHDDVRRRIEAAEPRRLSVVVKGFAAKGGGR